MVMLKDCYFHIGVISDQYLYTKSLFIHKDHWSYMEIIS